MTPILRAPRIPTHPAARPAAVASFNRHCAETLGLYACEGGCHRDVDAAVVPAVRERCGRVLCHVCERRLTR